jgi:hypothetical protein
MIAFHFICPQMVTEFPLFETLKRTSNRNIETSFWMRRDYSARMKRATFGLMRFALGLKV